MTKKEIRVRGFNKLYADLGNNLDDLLTSGRLKRSINRPTRSFPYNTRWESGNQGHRWFLFEIDDSSELSGFEALTHHQKRYYDTPYKAKSFPGKTFFLTSEFYEDPFQNEDFCDTINSFAKAKKVAPYIDSADFKVLIMNRSVGLTTTSPTPVSSVSTPTGTSPTSKPVAMTRPSYGATASMSFDYIPEGGMALTPEQEDLLRKIERTSCALDEFSCIRELRRAKRYRVVVSDKKSFIDTVNKELEAYQNYINSLNNKLFQQDPNLLTERERELMHTEILGCIKSNLENNLERLQSTDGHVLLGLYRNCDYSYNSPTIYLFKENIDAYAAREGVSSDYVFGFVYIHEAMHAFFNSKNAEGYLSVRELEEAFAECGMLDFLTRVGSALPKDLYEAAKQNVLLKQYNGPYEYGFGLALYESSSSYGETSKIISRYREISNWIGRRNYEVYDYQRKVRSLKRVSDPDASYNSGAADCYALVKKILAGSYSAPAYDLTILPGLSKYMRAAGVVLKPTPRVAGSFPSILPGNGWPAHLYSGSNLRPLVQLAVTYSVDDVVYAIFKLLERRFPWLLENVIRSLNIQTRPAGDTSVPGEWLRRSINFRDDGAKDIQGGWSFGAGLRPENTSVVCLLRAVSWFGGDGNEFYVLANDGKYVLFGSAKFRRFLEE